MKNIFKTIKIKWNNYLKRLAETNKQLYGSGRLDCCSLNTQDKKAEAGGKGMDKHITLQITGMACHTCAEEIRKALTEEASVKVAYVDLISNEAYITGKEDMDINKLIAAVENLGYGASMN
jgi:copper chaperone CopZ